MKNVAILFILFFSMMPVTEMKSQENVIYIENGGTRIGVLPSRGGRVVFLSKNDCPNLLKAFPEQWSEGEKDRPDMSAFSEWKEYNGHIVWLGPQSEWWTQQDYSPARKQARANWPPDPFLIYADYRLNSRDASSVELRGPESKVSGVSLLKKISIDEDGVVLFEVKATNMRRQDVSWDLWLNTRVSGMDKSYVPVEDESMIRIDARRVKQTDTVRWLHCDGYFGYAPAKPVEGFIQNSSKAFITPSQNWMAVFSSGHCLKIEFPETDPARVHPEQAVVEIYNRTAVDETLDITEMEFHTEYKVFQPGESFKTWEKWIIYDYKGENDTRSHIRFLNRKVKD